MVCSWEVLSSPQFVHSKALQSLYLPDCAAGGEAQGAGAGAGELAGTQGTEAECAPLTVGPWALNARVV